MSDQTVSPGTTAPRPGEADDGTGPFRYGANLAADIELRWQRHWAQAGTFRTPNPSGELAEGFDEMAGRPRFYVLDMFPCPSGTGIHVGHPLGYIATDVYARYLRMTGHHVLHAMGFDSFGLPAEQFALETGQHPRETTRQNIASMRGQLQRLGIGHDDRRSVETTDPGFYKWTQWIFLRIYNSWVDETGVARPISELITQFESGARPVPGGRAWADLPEADRRALVDDRRLAYLSQELVNWCPGLGTVLANEEVTADGRSDIGNFPVYRRPLRQWMMRITAMAQRLIDDLEPLDWPESIKHLQRNWIGASPGAVIWLPLAQDASPASEPAGDRAGEPAGSAARVEVFTTRPDTLAGATFAVLAPEHPLAGSLLPAQWPVGTPPEWRYPQGRPGPEAGNAGDDSWRPADAVAAYREAASRLSDRQRMAGGAKSGVFTGSYVVNPATGGRLPVFVADYVLMGYGTGAIMAVPAHDQRDLDFAREFGLPVQAVLAPPQPWLAARGIGAGEPAALWPEAFDGQGDYLAAAGPDLAGLTVQAAIDASTSWLEQRGAGHAAHRFRLRDWLFSRQRYWGEPFPVVYDDDGQAIALGEDQLPVLLPEVTDFRPDRDQDGAGDAPGSQHWAAEPVPPLARAADWAIAELDLGDGVRPYRRELNTMPQWAGSCWYYLRYLDPGNSSRFVEPEVERYWMAGPGSEPGDGGVDLYVGGPEHAVLHLLYARFWHKVLFDLGLVSTREPFRKLVNNGYILADAFVDERGSYVPAADVIQASDGSAAYHGHPVTRRTGKMGKSLKNGVSPDEMCRLYGADTMRLYEMASGPLEASRPWRAADIVGVHRFLQRLWRSMVDEQTGTLTVSDAALDQASERALHATIAAVRDDFGELRFNTAVARLMELTTIAARISAADGALPRALAEPLVLMVAPLAPHVADELWARLGHPGSLAYADFPQADPVLARAQTITLPVQINGRTRFTVQAPADASAAELERLVVSDPRYAAHTQRLAVQRLVVVPGRIVNVVAR
ncbi:MAG TPA: class I tRNA ligase family protein [Streptosporangiaceae bacterium]|nr:class I tRNA ligase family protein [Streptosporangiaceae bacterium]